jgi:hypothetical protein
MELLRRHFNASEESVPAGKDMNYTTTDAILPQRFHALQALHKNYPLHMQCLVAIVPDPIDSHLQLTFDGALAAITRALEQHEYVLDRHDLPWSKEIRDRPITGQREVVKYRQPGAVLFRRQRTSSTGKAGSECELLMLLLVGETPTGGVRSRSFCAALDFVTAWEAVVAEASPGSWHPPLSIRVLGPSFSGSAHSMRLSIVNWREARQWWFAERTAHWLIERTYPPQVAKGGVPILVRIGGHLAVVSGETPSTGAFDRGLLARG